MYIVEHCKNSPTELKHYGVRNTHYKQYMYFGKCNYCGNYILHLHTLFGKRLNIKKYEKQQALNLFKTKTECYNNSGVYFLKQGDSVKIGFSNTIKNRIIEIQVGSPEKQEFLFTIQGTIQTEKKLHNKFKQYNIRGEWFKIDGELEEFINYFIKFRNSFIKLQI